MNRTNISLLVLIGSIVALGASPCLAGDPQCVRFTIPSGSTLIANTSITPEVEYRNPYQFQAKNWTVTFTVRQISSNQIVFQYTTPSSTFWEDCTLFFNTSPSRWTAYASGLYELKAVGQSPDDIDPGNNACTKLFTVLDPLFTSGNFPSSGQGADPVNLFLGEFFHREPPDLVLPGPMPLEFRRYYASSLSSATRPPMGTHWRHSYETSLSRQGDTVVVTMDDGRLIIFLRNGGMWNLQGRKDVPFQLVANGTAFIFGDPRPQQLYTFRDGKLIQIEDGHGNSLHLIYDPDSRLSTVTDSLGRTFQLSYRSDSLLAGVTDGIRTVTFSYANRMLVSVTDARGNSVLYTYAAAPSDQTMLVSKTLPEGNIHYVHAYDSRNRVVSQTNAVGDVTTISYADTLGGATTVTDAMGHTTSMHHSASGELLRYTDEAGKDIVFEYDSRSLRTGIRDRMGDRTTMAYNPQDGRLVLLAHANGAATTFDHVARTVKGVTFHDISNITYPDATEELFGYDGSGNVLLWTDRSGKLWEYSYNARGQVLTIRNPANGITTLTYSAEGMMSSIKDQAGNTTTYEYDQLFRLTRIAYADGASLSYAYDPHDNILSATNERGHTTSMTYDKNDNLLSVTDPSNHTIQFQYDTMDRIIKVTDAKGNAMSGTYDKLGRMISVTDRSGNVTKLGYDDRGRLTSITDAGNNVWQTMTDDEGIITSATNPLSRTTSFASNKLGYIEQATTPLANSWKRLYDIMGRPTITENPYGHRGSFAYDALGLVSEIVLPGDSIRSTLVRNPLGLITTATDPRGKRWMRAYDTQGRLISLTDPLNHTTQFTYDSRNRARGVSWPDNLGTLALSYDSSGNVTRAMYSDGTDLRFSYDVNNRLTSANRLSLGYDENGWMNSCNGQLIERDKDGRITGITYDQGKKVSYAYNARGLVSQITDWTGAKMMFTYDAAGRKTRTERPNGINTTYAYDQEHNLTIIQHGSTASIMISRDKEGKILSSTRSVPARETASSLSKRYSYNDANHIESFSYDALGRVLNDQGTTYEWDLAGRLNQTTRSGNTSTHQYDALGMRTRSQDDGAIRDFTWNYAFPLPVLTAEQHGSERTFHIYSPSGMLVASVDQMNRHRYYHFDEGGNTLFLTDDGGRVTDSYSYTPYGTLLRSMDSTKNRFTWLGQFGVFAEGSDRYFIRDRIYDASTGRFLSRDHRMSVHPMAVNPYQYGYDNPLTFADRNGFTPENRKLILIESRFVTVEERFHKSLGINWINNSPVSALPTSRINPPSNGSYQNPFSSTLSGMGDLPVLLEDLAASTDTRIISAPTILTLGNRPAVISMGNQQPFTARYAPNGEKAITGGMTVFPPTPRVSGGSNGWFYDRFKYELPRGTFGGTTRIQIPELRLMRIQSTISIPDGGTVLLGGLLNDSEPSTTKVPILGDIPGLGRLFTNRNSSTKNRELLIFITPRIVQD